MGTQPGSRAVRVDIEAPLDVANWRPLVHWLLAIPQLLITSALRALRGVLMLISFFTVLFTKTIPPSIFEMIVMTLRYDWRVGSYVLWMREAYPPFEFDTVADDPGTDPARLSIDHPGELARWMPLVKWFLAIPHFIVLAFLLLGGFFVGLGAFFVVLFTGRWPEGMRSYLVGVNRYSTRVVAYAGFLRDEYPPFSLQG